MKQGFSYALGIVIAILALVVLFQQRKLAEVRDHNSALRGDTRALISTRNTDAVATAEIEKELRQLRTENDDLRREVDQLRGSRVRDNDTSVERP